MREKISQAVEELAAIPYFPADAGARTAIMRQLSRFVDRPDRLRWLVDTALARMDSWLGVAQLRALYATKYRPADGIPGGDCLLPGFTPADNESAYLLERAQSDQKLLAEAKAAAESLSPEERAEIAALQALVSDRAKKPEPAKSLKALLAASVDRKPSGVQNLNQAIQEQQ